MARGAEAIIEQTTFLGLPAIKKTRIPKSYRVQPLDLRIRKSRTKSEAKFLTKLRQLIPVPHLYWQEEFTIYVEYIGGTNLQDYIHQTADLTPIARYGELIGILHSHNIMHGDPTTSNFIVSSELYAIDFGLTQHVSEQEHLAEDLIVAKRSMESTHYDLFPEIWSQFLKGYLRYSSKSIVKKAREITARARYQQRINA